MVIIAIRDSPIWLVTYTDVAWPRVTWLSKLWLSDYSDWSTKRMILSIDSVTIIAWLCCVTLYLILSNLLFFPSQYDYKMEGKTDRRVYFLYMYRYCHEAKFTTSNGPMDNHEVTFYPTRTPQHRAVTVTVTFYLPRSLPYQVSVFLTFLLWWTRPAILPTWLSRVKWTGYKTHLCVRCHY